jgi:hypothetical protein
MTYEIRCELCENVDRGMDDYSHEVHWISNRCPLYEFSVTYCKINGHFPPVMLIVSLTGCKHFKEDLDWKKTGRRN